MDAGDRKWGMGKKGRVLILAVGCLLFAVTVCTATILFLQSRQVSDASDSRDTAASNRIIKSVSALYLTPVEETPTVAKIREKHSIQGNQEFYGNAQNGDYVLVYQTEKIAILYRESINKIIKVSPISAGPPAVKD